MLDGESRLQLPDRPADLADAGVAGWREPVVIETYLPEEVGEAELETLVRSAIERTGAQGPRDMGRVIKDVLAAAQGRADGRRVSAKVKELL